ncbi:unnamed protein product, partial [Prunus brigantina]
MFTKENLKNVTFVAQEGVEIEKGLRIKRFVTGKRMLGFVVPTYDVIGKAQFINWRSGNDVAAGVARDLLTPRDLKTLGKKDESIAVDDAMAISIQCASSVANLGQRLLVKNQEVRELTLQLGNLRVALRECHTLIKDQNELKNEHDQATLEAYKLREELSMDRERNAQEALR